jgi:Tat protein translocase TatB subunit
MFGIGLPELVVIMVIALVVLGPKRLPEVARSLGRLMSEFRRQSAEIMDEFQHEARLDEELHRSRRVTPAAAPGTVPARAAGGADPPPGSAAPTSPASPGAATPGAADRPAAPRAGAAPETAAATPRPGTAPDASPATPEAPAPGPRPTSSTGRS